MVHQMNRFLLQWFDLRSGQFLVVRLVYQEPFLLDLMTAGRKKGLAWQLLGKNFLIYSNEFFYSSKSSFQTDYMFNSILYNGRKINK